MISGNVTGPLFLSKNTSYGNEVPLEEILLSFGIVNFKAC
jgi:hypothetical protein